MPKVSVIIPTYNRSRYIGEAVTSVLAQTCRDYEIIVVDDGSTDDTKAVVDRFGEKVRYIWQPNQGRSKARNVGIEKALGTHLVFLDSDDVILPRKLELQVAFLDEHPTIGVVYSDLYYCDSAGHDLALFSESQPGRQFTGDVLGELVQGNFLPIHAALIRKSCLVEAGAFDETLPSQEDWDLWIRIAQKYCFAYLNEPVAKYRVHQGMTFGDAHRIVAGDVAVRQKIRSYPFFDHLSPKARWGFYYTCGRLHCATGDMRQGRHFFRQALAIDPRHAKTYALLGLSLLGQTAYRAVVTFKRARHGNKTVLADHW